MSDHTCRFCLHSFTGRRRKFCLTCLPPLGEFPDKRDYQQLYNWLNAAVGEHAGWSAPSCRLRLEKPKKRRDRPLSTKSTGRAGHRWRVLRQQVIDESTHCGICGGSVDKTLSGLSPWGPTVDHIIPRAYAFHLAAVRENLQLAHNKCNRDKAVVDTAVLKRSAKALIPCSVLFAKAYTTSLVHLRSSKPHRTEQLRLIG
jgi:5-methylcytosine-specific restriction endonuclease McrA